MLDTISTLILSAGVGIALAEVSMGIESAAAIRAERKRQDQHRAEIEPLMARLRAQAEGSSLVLATRDFVTAQCTRWSLFSTLSVADALALEGYRLERGRA